MNYNDISSLLDHYATAKQVHALLARYKEAHPDDVRLGGTKPELLDCLKTCIQRNIIPGIEPFNLLRDAEENGDQHIYYYRPLTVHTRKRCSDPEAVGDALFGPNWVSRMRFPRLFYKSNSYDVVDFRELPHKPGDWLLKLYAYTTRDKRVGHEEREDGRFAVIWQREERRAVIAGPLECR